MTDALFFAAISATFVLCCRNLWQAYRESAIWYRGDKWEREKNPFFFWITVLLCIGFGMVSPLLLFKIVMGEL